MHIVLVEPEIPQNTGNIARTCAATGSPLHLVGPLGFSIADKWVKRAGLDYWHLVDIRQYANLEELWATYPNGTFWYLSTKAKRYYSHVSYGPNDFLVFGKETKGLPEDVLRANPDHAIRIPMRAEARSLNLANTVALVLYEALRQQGYPGLC
ncbi:MAG: tRNA (uridine(34)/cytosine(34)/5-carboxymethylaminomethyluridine(34)-2'-O)-methyltransferase TrmL [Firmicutes bacterium]|nr:tRNA (uridine(34)/cytosine(34)/5-carboxymethylaminomethyluridine(34)-2'-O)-methyltransferase TrmL [Bacillota bacterium]